jgi:hypothetical protein
MQPKPFILALPLLLLTACAPSAADAPISDQWRSADLEIAPVELGEDRIGMLHFRGGLELASRDPRFGGLSGMEVLEDGRLIAVSDDGMWFMAQLVFDDEGALIGLSAARLASMRDERAEPFERKQDGDAEGLAQLSDGRFAVSFEGLQAVRIYDLNRDGPFGAAAQGPSLADIARLPQNAGLEAMSAMADGDLIIGAEGGALWRAALERETEQAPLAQSYPLEFGFSLVSLDRLPGSADFVALERFFAPVIGVRTRITRLSAASLAGDGPARVTEWAFLEPPALLDNFESISATRGPDGGLRIYILSDDNFSSRQRTLLYAFDVALD